MISTDFIKSTWNSANTKGYHSVKFREALQNGNYKVLDSCIKENNYIIHNDLNLSFKKITALAYAILSASLPLDNKEHVAIQIKNIAYLISKNIELKLDVDDIKNVIAEANPIICEDIYHSYDKTISLEQYPLIAEKMEYLFNAILKKVNEPKIETFICAFSDKKSIISEFPNDMVNEITKKYINLINLSYKENILNKDIEWKQLVDNAIKNETFKTTESKSDTTHKEVTRIKTEKLSWEKFLQYI